MLLVMPKIIVAIPFFEMLFIMLNKSNYAERIASIMDAALFVKPVASRDDKSPIPGSGISLSFRMRAAYIRTAIRVHMSAEEFSEDLCSSTKLALFFYLLMIVFDALHRIFFEDRKKHDVLCGCALLL